MKRFFLLCLLFWSFACLGQECLDLPTFTVRNNGPGTAFGVGVERRTGPDSWYAFSVIGTMTNGAVHAGAGAMGTWRVSYRETSTGPTLKGPSVSMPCGGSFNFNVWGGGNGVTPWVTNTISFCNQDTKNQVFEVRINGAVADTGMLAPGECWEKSYRHKANEDVHIEGGWVGEIINPVTGDGVPTWTPGTAFSNDGDTNGVTETVTGPPPTSPLPYSTNAPPSIDWGGAVETDAILQRGFDATRNSLDSVNRSLGDISAKITRGNNLLSEISGRLATNNVTVSNMIVVTNVVSGGGTNGGDVTTLVPLLESIEENTFQTRTNTAALLADLRESTNISTNFPDHLLFLLDSDAIFDAGNEAAESLVDGFDQASGLLVVPQGEIGGAGNWVISVAGWTFNLNPMSIDGVAELAAKCREIIRWLVFCAFCFFVTNEVKGYLVGIGSVRQISIPNVTKGVFGNIMNLGILAVPVYAVVFTAAFALLPAAFFMFWPDYAAELMGNPFAGGSGPVAQGIWLADQFVPLLLIIQLLITALIWRLTCAKLYVLTASVLRHCFG